MFTYDGTGVSMDGPLLKDGFYAFRIMDAEELTSKKKLDGSGGYPMVKIRADVVGDPEFSGWPVFHYVVFLPKDNAGAGIALNFLKAIGLPYDGKIEIDVEEWKGKTFRAKVVTESFNDRKSNKIAQVAAMTAASGSGLPF